MKKCVFLLVVFIVLITSAIAQPSSSSAGSTVEEFYKSTYVHKRTGTTIQFTIEGQRDSSWRSPELKKNESYVAIKPIFRHVDVNIQKTPLISADDAVKALTSPGKWIQTKPAGEGYPPNDFQAIKDTYNYGSFPYIYVTIKHVVYKYQYNEHSSPPRFEKKTDIEASVSPAFNIVIIWAAIGALLAVSLIALLRKKFSDVWSVELGDVVAVVSSGAFVVCTLFYGWSSVWHAFGYYILLLVIYHILPEQMRVTEDQKKKFKIMEHFLIALSSMFLFLFFILSDRQKMGYIVGITISAPFIFWLICAYLNLKTQKSKLFSKVQK